MAGSRELDNVRYIFFPEDRPLGELQFRDFGVTGGWQRLGSAVGRVAVPLGKEVRLKIAPGEQSGPLDLSPLRQLELDDLQWIDLSRTTVADADLANLANLSLLRRLDLHGTSIGDAGLRALKPLTALRELKLNETKVSDVGLVALVGMTEMETLWLFDCPGLTAAAARPLERMKALKILQLPKGFPAVAIAELSRALPECYINVR